MRDTTGSAAAPAARCRKFRRGSFILNLPSHHSITSSARASSVGGISRPSALAVLRLMTSSYLVGRLYWQVARLLTPEDTVDVAGRAAELVEVVEVIRHQAAAHDVLAVSINRRQTMPCRKCDDQLPIIKHAPARRRDQAAVRLARECCDGARFARRRAYRSGAARPRAMAQPSGSRRTGRVRPP